VARVISPQERTAVAIRDATRDVLGDPRYRSNATHFQAEMAALSGPERVVELLELLAGQGAPTDATRAQSDANSQ
jgi:UDP:flavonoid glycosyltransferase YjiC (YdhE family)